MILDKLRAEHEGSYSVGQIDAFLRHGAQTLSKAGIPITFDSAFRIAAVYACVRIISEAMASLPLIIYRRLENDGKERFRSHPLFRLLRRKANNLQTAAGWMETAMVHLLLRGNHYSLKIRVNGEVTELIPIRPELVEPKFQNGDLEYEIKPDTEKGESGSPVTLTRDKIFHIVGKSSDGITGRSVIRDAVDVMGTSSALEQHTASIFRNGTHIGGVFQHPGTLGEEEYKRLNEELKTTFSGSENTAKWFIAEGGMKLERLGMTNDDAQLIDAQKFQIAQIARFYGVPLHKLLDIQTQPRANMEQMAAEWVQDGLRPWATRIEQTVDDQLLGGDEEVFSQFLFEDLLRGDLEARTNHYTAMFRIGAYTLDDIMARENLNPIGGEIGQRRFRDIQLIPIESDGTTVQQPQEVNQ